MTVLDQGLIASEQDADTFAAFVAARIPDGSQRKMWSEATDDDATISHWWFVQLNGEEIFVIGSEVALDKFCVAFMGKQ